MTRHNCPGFDECPYCDHLAERREMGLGRDDFADDWQIGQSRYEDRGTTDALYLWVGSILVAFGALSILWPLLVWLLLGAVVPMVIVGVVCVVVGARGERG